MQKFDTRTFQGLILTLQDYWARQGCTIVQPLDMEVGAGTSHPMTSLRALGQQFRHLAADIAGPVDVGFEIDGLLCGSNGLQHGRKDFHRYYPSHEDSACDEACGS